MNCFGTDPTQRNARAMLISAYFYGFNPANMSYYCRSYLKIRDPSVCLSAMKDLDHQLAMDGLFELWKIAHGWRHNKISGVAESRRFCVVTTRIAQTAVVDVPLQICTTYSCCIGRTRKQSHPAPPPLYCDDAPPGAIDPPNEIHFMLQGIAGEYTPVKLRSKYGCVNILGGRLGIGSLLGSDYYILLYITTISYYVLLCLTMSYCVLLCITLYY